MNIYIIQNINNTKANNKYRNQNIQHTIAKPTTKQKIQYTNTCTNTNIHNNKTNHKTKPKAQIQNTKSKNVCTTITPKIHTHKYKTKLQ